MRDARHTVQHRKGPRIIVPQIVPLVTESHRGSPGSGSRIDLFSGLTVG